MVEEKKSFVNDRLGLCIMPALVIILEALPFGASLMVDGEMKHFSYFSGTLLNNNNVWYLVTAVLSIILLASLVVYNFVDNKYILKFAKVFAVVTAVFSFFPIVLGYGFNHLTILSVVVTLCLIVSYLFLLKHSKLIQEKN